MIAMSIISLLISIFALGISCFNLGWFIGIKQQRKKCSKFLIHEIEIKNLKDKITKLEKEAIQKENIEK